MSFFKFFNFRRQDKEQKTVPQGLEALAEAIEEDITMMRNIVKEMWPIYVERVGKDQVDEKLSKAVSELLQEDVLEPTKLDGEKSNSR